MSTAQKLIAATSGTGSDELYVDDVFSTTIYTGTGSALTITNNIDLDNEGGLVWFKRRNGGHEHGLYDTARGTGKRLSTNNTSAEETDSNGLSVFRDTGFTVVSADDCNGNSDTYASWAFRKAEKFFDIVTYTGDGSSSNSIAHNLGGMPGFIVIKRTDSTSDWHCIIRYEDTNYMGGGAANSFALNNTAIVNNGVSPSNRGITTTHFDAAKTYGGVGSFDVSKTNVNNATYVAYLWAHNDSDGEYGSGGDQDIIKCGGVATDGSGAATVTLGFEPQWVLLKNTAAVENWQITDAVRGMPVGAADFLLLPNSSNAESTYDDIDPNGTGFNLKGLNASQVYSYVAIRRPMKVPEVGTTVFMPSAYRSGTRPSAATVTTAGFSPDLYATQGITGVYNVFFDKVRGVGKRLRSDGNNTELTDATNWLRSFDATGVTLGADTGAAIVNYNNFSYRDLFFRRAAGFFDIQAWAGDNAAPRNISHSLGVAPELIILKNRSASGGGANWVVGVASLGNDEGALNNDNGFAGYNNITTYSTTTFTLLNGAEEINKSGNNYIAYLFATADGVSKVGTYTGNGSSLTIDCGFSNGARFVMTKRTDAAGHWNVFDTARTFDERLEWDTAAAEINGDWLDADNSGFVAKYVANNTQDSNISGADYMFLAIA